MEQQTYNTEQVAKILGVGRDYARSLIHTGKLPNVGNSKRVRIPKAALQRFLEGAK
jgi:excisionase family DNA binding protein